MGNGMEAIVSGPADRRGENKKIGANEDEGNNEQVKVEMGRNGYVPLRGLRTSHTLRLRPSLRVQLLATSSHLLASLTHHGRSTAIAIWNLCCTETTTVDLRWNWRRLGEEEQKRRKGRAKVAIEKQGGRCRRPVTTCSSVRQEISISGEQRL